MKISFSSNALRRDFMSERSLRRAYGDLAERIGLRLRTLAFARSLADVPKGPPERCHRLIGRDKDLFAITLNGNWRLLFRPEDGRLPVGDDGQPDLAAVTSIIIVDIVDYH